MSNRRSAAPKGQERVRSSPVLSAFSFFFRGLVEAPRLDLALAAVSRSETARAAALQCFCFNGLILVSLLAWRWAVAPAVAAAAAAQSYSFPPLLSSLAAAFFAPRAEEDPSSQTPLELTAAFVLAWVFPASAVALSLSGPWCLAVAKGVFEEEGRRRGSSGGSGRGGGGGGGGGRSRSRSRSRAAKRSSSRGATSSPSPTTTTTRRKGSSSSSSSSSSSAAALPAAAASAEAEALELYRGTLFSLLWAQAGLSRLAPLPRRLAFAGPLASTLLTWLLYGLMAFDYRFTAESEKSLSLGEAARGGGEEPEEGRRREPRGGGRRRREQRGRGRRRRRRRKRPEKLLLLRPRRSRRRGPIRGLWQGLALLPGLWHRRGLALPRPPVLGGDGGRRGPVPAVCRAGRLGGRLRPRGAPGGRLRGGGGRLFLFLCSSSSSSSSSSAPPLLSLVCRVQPCDRLDGPGRLGPDAAGLEGRSHGGVIVGVEWGGEEVEGKGSSDDGGSHFFVFFFFSILQITLLLLFFLFAC